MPEGEFSSATKEIIAKRAGYVCSFPNCGRLLIGPASNPNEASFIGHVSHIFPASDSGPRGKSGIAIDQLKSPHNGILLCAHHHSMIDSDRGSKYSASALRSMKDIHEQRISFQTNQYSSPIGWIDRITIDSSPILNEESSITFGKVTLLYGENASGKTYICDLLRGSFYPEALGRWLNRNMKSSVSYFSPVEHHVTVKLNDAKITYTLDKEDMFLNPYNISIVSPIEKPSWNEEDDDILFLSRTLGIDEFLFLNMIRDKNAVIGLTFKDFEMEISRDDDGQPVRQLRTQLQNGASLTYGMLSGGEKACCQIDLSIAMARFLSKYRPCSLILDSQMIGSIDASNTKRYIEHLASSSIRFQTIWVSSNKEPRINWTGWQIAKVVGQPPQSSIIQDSL